MAFRRAGRPGLVRAPKRRTIWNGNSIDLADVAVAGAFSVILTEALLENTPNGTIVRLRGEIFVTVDNAISDPLSRGMITMGIMLVDNKALAAGIGSLQLPLTAIGSDWMWWYSTGFGEVGSTTVSDIGVSRVVVDSKAMRKVSGNQALVFVCQVVNCEGAPVANVCGTVRVLCKLP